LITSITINQFIKRLIGNVTFYWVLYAMFLLIYVFKYIWEDAH